MFDSLLSLFTHTGLREIAEVFVILSYCAVQQYAFTVFRRGFAELSSPELCAVYVNELEEESQDDRG